MYGKGRVKVMSRVSCACTEGTLGMTLTSEANEEREAFRVSARREGGERSERGTRSVYILPYGVHAYAEKNKIKRPYQDLYSVLYLPWDFVVRGRYCHVYD